MANYNAFKDNTVIPSPAENLSVSAAENKLLEAFSQLIKDELFDGQIKELDCELQSVEALIKHSASNEQLRGFIEYFVGPSFIRPHSPHLTKILMWNAVQVLFEESSADLLTNVGPINLYDWVLLTKNNCLSEIFSSPLNSGKPLDHIAGTYYEYTVYLNTAKNIVQHAGGTLDNYQRNLVMTVYTAADNDIHVYNPTQTSPINSA